MLKRAALTIATLAEADRTWLFAQLTAEERNKLEPVVAEAVALGMHRDPAVLEMLNAPPRKTLTEQVRPHQLSDVLLQLPPFWRSLAAESEASADIDTSGFLNMLLESQSGPKAMRRALVELALAKRETEHV